jgi:hypothetical protein
MAPQTVMASHAAVVAVRQAGLLFSSAMRGSPLSPWPHAPSAQQTRYSSLSAWDAALAAAAWAGWCQVQAVASAATPGTTSERGEEARAGDVGRARPVTCGLWLARRGLVATVLGPGVETRRVIRAAVTDDARFGLVEYLATAGAEIVATEALARVDLMPVQAARRGLAVWTAADALVAALLRAAAIRDPARAAALLARLPVIPLLRSSIRRLDLPDRRQLPLL